MLGNPTGFEALISKVDGNTEEKVDEDGDKSYTKEAQRHIDCCYGYKVVFRYDDKYSRPVKLHRGKNAVYRVREQMIK